MKNESCVIGLFQGMFDKNVLTFNPGWNQNAENLDNFTDVRLLQKQLKEKGIKILTEANELSEGQHILQLKIQMVIPFLLINTDNSMNFRE